MKKAKISLTEKILQEMPDYIQLTSSLKNLGYCLKTVDNTTPTHE